MIPHIKNIYAPKNSTPYVPVKNAVVSDGNSIDMEFTGRGGNTFGFDRILPGGSDLGDITATAMLNEDLILFENVKLSVLRDHFLNKALLAPFVIQKNNTLRLTLTNNSGQDRRIGIQLLGYDAPFLTKLIRAYQEKGIEMPRPAFLHTTATVAADAVSQSIDIKTKSLDVRMVRATIRTDSDENILIAMQVYNESVKNSVFIQQFNDEFQNGYADVPYVIGKAVPLSLLADNLDNNPYELSFLGEAYVMKPGE